MLIEKNSVVSLHYRLQEGDPSGQLVEETFGKQPLTFLYGVGQMLPEFERQLEGKQSGDDFAFGIRSKDAYGEHDPAAVVEIPKNVLGITSPEQAKELLQIGKMLPLQDNQGRQFQGKVVKTGIENVTLDLNHPMAGVDLYFTGVIESIRAATPSEIEHGHVHGPGGHHH